MSHYTEDRDDEDALRDQYNAYLLRHDARHAEGAVHMYALSFEEWKEDRA